MKTIPLSQGKVALVDDADYEAVSKFKWFAAKRGRLFYAARNIRKPDGKKTLQYLHQFLIPGVPEIDHEDGNGLNNQRGNLRSVTHLQNVHGFQRKRLDTTSSFRGACWDRQMRKWRAKIQVGSKQIFLGLFTLEVDAALAYDAAVRKYRGEFASTNF